MIAAMGRYESLIRALDDGVGGPRAVVDALLSSGPGLREVQRRYNERAGPLLIGSRGANPGTIGTAFNIGTRFLIDPRPNMSIAAAVAEAAGEGSAVAVAGLIERLGARTERVARRGTTKPLTSPLQVPERDLEELARATWALALYEKAHRTSGILPESPLDSFLDRQPAPTVDDLLGLADPSAVRELQELLALASEQLLPAIAHQPEPWFIGPVFPLSSTLDADVDLIAGSLLVELKTSLGKRTASGLYSMRISRETLRQIIGYVLHDGGDDYALTEVALYSARYGYFACWSISDLLTLTAGRRVDLAEERERWRTAVSTS